MNYRTYLFADDGVWRFQGNRSEKPLPQYAGTKQRCVEVRWTAEGNRVQCSFGRGRYLSFDQDGVRDRFAGSKALVETMDAHDIEERAKRMKVPDLRMIYRARKIRAPHEWTLNDADKAQVVADLLPNDHPDRLRIPYVRPLDAGTEKQEGTEEAKMTDQPGTENEFSRVYVVAVIASVRARTYSEADRKISEVMYGVIKGEKQIKEGVIDRLVDFVDGVRSDFHASIGSKVVPCGPVEVAKALPILPEEPQAMDDLLRRLDPAQAKLDDETQNTAQRFEAAGWEVEEEPYGGGLQVRRSKRDRWRHLDPGKHEVPKK
jgi:hypothetical protein